MSIISTFDPKFKKQLLARSREEFGEGKVIFIRKSHLFLCINVLLPLILRLSVLITLITCTMLYTPWVWLKITLCIIILLVFTVPGYKILKFFLDYEMDFAVVTPKTFLRYNQTGFFKRSSKAIDMKHVRSVYVKKAGFFNSIFNNGHIIVLTEGSVGNPQEDGNNPGEVEFRYVYNPEYYSERIQKLLSEIEENY